MEPILIMTPALECTRVIVSRSMKELAEICDEGACLDEGRVVDASPMQSVIVGYQLRMGVAEPVNPAARA